ncbi:MAG: MarR family winged helix-turn-helix transcriptional regulator [Gemmataceae bacterium]
MDSDFPRDQLESLQQKAYLAIWRTYDCLRSFEEKLFAEFHITPQQYNMLRLLDEASPGSLPASQIQAGLITRAPDITRMTDRLVEAGWVVRERCEDDRRVVKHRITRDGQVLLQRIEPQLQVCHADQLGHLSEDQLTDLIDLLRETRRPHDRASSRQTFRNASHDSQ